MVTEKQLIDVNSLVGTLSVVAKKMAKSDAQQALMGRVLYIIEHKPTVDAVEVVLCKDCACYEEICPEYGYCYHWDYEQGMSPNQVESDDFCSYGERRT